MGKKKKLQDLPSDDEAVDSDTENNSLDILNNVLNLKESSPGEYSSIKHILYATALFFILSLPFTDKILELMVPVANSWLILLAVKTIAFFCGYYLLTRFLA